MLSPAWWAVTPMVADSSVAGLDILSGHRQQAPGGQLNHQLLRYVEAHDGHAKYLFATGDSNSASPYIIKAHRPVMAMGGFTGNDPAMKVAHFKRLVKTGQVKFYYGGRSTANQSTINWIKKHGRKVSLAQSPHNSRMHGPGSGNTLYGLSHVY